MDPKDIQNTKFCNGNVNNITSNDIKSIFCKNYL